MLLIFLNLTSHGITFIYVYELNRVTPVKFSKYESPSLFINNRNLLSAKLEENSIAIFNANDIMPTNSDGTMPFKQNSDLFWLSGVDQEESVLAIVKNNNQVQEMLFLKETNVGRLQKIITKYEIFKYIINVPGDICEFGVFKGSGIFTWVKLKLPRNIIIQ